MILHAFYNYKGAGDVLLVRLGKGTCNHFDTDGNLVILKDAKDNVIGYNILNATKEFGKLGNGKIEITPEFVETLNGILEVKNQTTVTSDFDDHIVVGKVVECVEHPDSDHLHICQVDKGFETVQIVCGAKNVAQGQLVVVADINAVMPSGLIIRPSKLRGEESKGMLCSAPELNLHNLPYNGILILDESDYSIGQHFYKRYGELNA